MKRVTREDIFRDNEGRRDFSGKVYNGKKGPTFCIVCGIDCSNSGCVLCIGHHGQWKLEEERSFKSVNRTHFETWVLDHPDFNGVDPRRTYCVECERLGVIPDNDYLCRECRANMAVIV